MREQLREKGTGDWRCGLARKTTRAGDLALVRQEEDAQRERRRDVVVHAKRKKEKGKFLVCFLFLFFLYQKRKLYSLKVRFKNY